MDDDITTETNSDGKLTQRSSTALEVSFDLIKSSVISPDHGDFEDMCMGDIRMLQELTKLYEVTTSVTDTGSPCIEVIENSLKYGYEDSTNQGSEGGRPGFTYKSTSKYCNRKMTYITRDTTITKSVKVNFEFWKKVIQGYLYTETEIKEHFETMLISLQQDGATVSEDDHTISVTESLPTGEQIKFVYNKHNNLLIYTELKDDTGAVKKTLAYEYACSPDGKIIPKTIYTKTSDTSTICKLPYTKQEWMVFENFEATL